MITHLDELKFPYKKKKSWISKIIDKGCDDNCKNCALIYTDDCSFLKAVRIHTVSMHFSSSR